MNSSTQTGYLTVKSGCKEYEVCNVKLNKPFKFLMAMGDRFLKNICVPIYVLDDKNHSVYADFDNMYYDPCDDDLYVSDNPKLLDFTEQPVEKQVVDKRLMLLILLACSSIVLFALIVFQAVRVGGISSDVLALSPVLLFLLIWSSFKIHLKIKRKRFVDRALQEGCEFVGTIYDVRDHYAAIRTSIFVDVDGKLVEIKNVDCNGQLFQFLHRKSHLEYSNYLIKLRVLDEEGFLIS